MVRTSQIDGKSSHLTQKTSRIHQCRNGIRSESNRFHDFFDMLFRAILDLLEFLVLSEFSKASFDHLEQFVDVLQKSCEFSTDLSCVQT
jgi:hypothetical protein